MASTVDLVTDSVPDISGKDEKSFGQLNLKEKFTYIREVITVEPLIGAYTMASILCTPTIYKLESEKSCRSNLQMNNTVCDAILYGQYENYTDQIDDIQILISNMQSWQQPMQSIMPLILVLFLGSFSDRHKLRKPFLIIPLFGELFAVAGCIASVIFMTSWPLEVFGVFQLVIPSFFGGLPMITMAVFAYIADVSTLEMRTLRIGIVQIVLNIIVPLTHLFSAHMFELTGYYGVFLTAGALYIFGIIYGIYWIKEPKSPVLDSERGLLRDIFDPKHAIDTVCLVIKKSPGNNRLYIAFVLVIVFLYTSVVDGEGGIFYYYTQNVFGWDIVEYNYFMLINVLVHLAGIAIGVPFFTKVMHLTDTMILLITFLDKIFSNFIFGFANTIALLYAAAIVSLLTGITPIGIRSLETKIVSENDLGKAQSLFGLFEALAPAISIPIYKKGIYNNTLKTFPSLYFFFGIILYAICSVIVTWIFWKEKMKNKLKYEPDIVWEMSKTHNIPMDCYKKSANI
ncbi:uncharacterized protein LOC130893961 [Diorhabda carinulata]|uniref:uncharacterized protein LOC130893961 n=1 Tax=Diorhabda carinulata TaxID=1163345 RepID=UPI0025A15E8D|nr:uncharacterized protein LOC130893961 [Diorhabda carinulata]